MSDQNTAKIRSGRLLEMAIELELSKGTLPDHGEIIRALHDASVEIDRLHLIMRDAMKKIDAGCGNEAFTLLYDEVRR
jgi:hypothetical protein